MFIIIFIFIVSFTKLGANLFLCRRSNFYREEQKIKSENSQKEKVSKQLDEKFDLNDVSGDYAAEQINKYKLQDNFEYAVKEVLNYYYDEDKKDEISSFENTIDSRANNLIKDYKEASQEVKTIVI